MRFQRVKIVIIIMLLALNGFASHEGGEAEIEDALRGYTLSKSYRESTDEEIQRFFREHQSDEGWLICFGKNVEGEDLPDIVSKIKYLQEETRAISPIVNYGRVIEYMEHDLPYVFFAQLLGNLDATTLYGVLLIHGMEAHGYRIKQDLRFGIDCVCESMKGGSQLARYAVEETGVLHEFSISKDIITAEEYQDYCMGQSDEWYEEVKVVMYEHLKHLLPAPKTVERISLEELARREAKRMIKGHLAATSYYHRMTSKKEDETGK